MQGSFWWKYFSFCFYPSILPRNVHKRSLLTFCEDERWRWHRLVVKVLHFDRWLGESGRVSWQRIRQTHGKESRTITWRRKSSLRGWPWVSWEQHARLWTPWWWRCCVDDDHDGGGGGGGDDDDDDVDDDDDDVDDGYCYHDDDDDHDAIMIMIVVVFIMRVMMMMMMMTMVKMTRNNSVLSFLSIFKVYDNPLENAERFEGFQDFVSTFHLYRGKVKTEEEEATPVGEFKVRTRTRVSKRHRQNHKTGESL